MELMIGVKPDFKELHPFGCEVMVRAEPTSKAVPDRSMSTLFMGVSSVQHHHEGDVDVQVWGLQNSRSRLPVQPVARGGAEAEVRRLSRGVRWDGRDGL